MAMSIEERRARDRERKRIKRAAEREAREAKLEAAREAAATDKPETPSMVEAIGTALAAMKWLQPSDEANKTQAKMLAIEIDAMTLAGETTKALSAHRALTAVLTALGGTPTVRIQHELRSLKLGRIGGENGGENENIETGKPETGGAIISKFERPPKRAK